jgi:hypothetical protein
LYRVSLSMDRVSLYQLCQNLSPYYYYPYYYY